MTCLKRIILVRFVRRAGKMRDKRTEACPQKLLRRSEKPFGRGRGAQVVLRRLVCSSAVDRFYAARVVTRWRSLVLFIRERDG